MLVAKANPLECSGAGAFTDLYAHLYIHFVRNIIMSEEHSCVLQHQLEGIAEIHLEVLQRSRVDDDSSPAVINFSSLK